MPNQPPKIHTMQEAAADLRISRRALQEIVKSYPFYFSNGLRKLFTEADLEAIIAALRPAVRLQISERRRSTARAPSDALTELQQLLSRKDGRRKPRKI